MEEEYKAWQSNPTPQNLGILLQKADTVLNSAVTSYAGGDKSLKGHAKLLAINAFKSYDPKKGTKLNTHLMNQLQPLRRISQDYRRTVHVPEKVDLALKQVFETERTFKDEHGRDPSDMELADRIGVSHKRLKQLRRYATPTVPVSSFDSGDEDSPDRMPGVFQPSPERIWTDFVYHDLSNIDKKILEWKTGLYGHPILQTQEIARRLNITPGAVSQRAAKISERMAEGRSVEV